MQGYRYAEETDDPSVLRAEFTPTTPFCPQTHTLTIGSFRAWNGLSERHEYDLVRVRAAPMHHQSEAINETTRRSRRRTSKLVRWGMNQRGIGSNPMERAKQRERPSRGDPEAPF